MKEAIAVHVEIDAQAYCADAPRLALLRHLANKRYWQSAQSTHWLPGSSVPVQQILDDVQQESELLHQQYQQARDDYQLRSAPYRGLQRDLWRLRAWLGLGHVGAVGLGVLAGVFAALAVTGPVVIAVVGGVAAGLAVAAACILLFRLFAQKLVKSAEKKELTLSNIGKPILVDRRFAVKRQPTPAGLVRPDPRARNQARHQWRLFQRRECLLARRVAANQQRFLQQHPAGQYCLGQSART